MAETLTREEHERQKHARLNALDQVLALVRGDDRWGSIEVIEFASYVLTGERPELPDRAWLPA